MATCGSSTFWCVLSFLAVFANMGMSQLSGGTQFTPSPDNCTAFNASAPCNFPDLEDKKYCLRNGSVVTGFCDAQEAVCVNHILLEKDQSLCTTTTRGTSVSPSRNSFSTDGQSKGSTLNIGEDSHHPDSHHQDSHHPEENTAATSLYAASRHVVVVCGFIGMTYASHLFALV